MTDGTTYRRNKVLIVPHNTVIAPIWHQNVIKVATKKHKDKLYIKREGIIETNDKIIVSILMCHNPKKILIKVKY